MKPFPNIWTDGTIASFWLQGYLVQVPIKLGSNDNRAHVIRWLHHQWPFRVKVGSARPSSGESQMGRPRLNFTKFILNSSTVTRSLSKPPMEIFCAGRPRTLAHVASPRKSFRLRQQDK